MQGYSSRSRSSLIMRKLTKVLVLVAAFTALFALTAFAAKNAWGQGEDGLWYYYGSDGEAVSSVWRSSNGKLYWLGDDYYMLTDSWAGDDGDMYVDETGAKVVNAWRKITVGEGDETEDRWFYFGSNGKAFKATGEAWTKKINGKTYGFDSDGKMLYGFVDENGEMINDHNDPILDCDYYFGGEDEGARVSGWFHWEGGFTELAAEDAWFYFKSGKKVRDAGNVLIERKYYNFDEYGRMATGWSAVGSASTATGSAYYWNADGSIAKKAWVYSAPCDNADGDQNWYRTGSNGELLLDQVILVSKKYYVLDSTGIMKSGLVQLNTEGMTTTAKLLAGGLTDKLASEIKAIDLTKGGLYFFSTEDCDAGGKLGHALTGTMTVALNDADYTFAFNKRTYAALHGYDKDSKMVYDHGMLQAAGSSIYAVKNIYSDKGVEKAGGAFFVDKAGKVVTKKGKYTDGDGTIWILKADVPADKNLPDFKVADDEYEYYVKKGSTYSEETKWAKASTVASDLTKLTKEEFNAKYVKGYDAFVYFDRSIVVTE